jgi:hypothetical protein
MIVIPLKEINLLLGSIHSEGVEKSSEDSDRRSDDGSSGHGGLESNNRCDDNNNTLDGVADGMGDGVDLQERKKSEG